MSTTNALPKFLLKESVEDTIIQWQRELNNLVYNLDTAGYLTITGTDAINGKQQLVDQYGINSEFIRWSRNAIANSDFNVKSENDTEGTPEDGFMPMFWAQDGTVLSVQSPKWVGNRSMKIPAGKIVQYNDRGIADAVVNPQVIIDAGYTHARFSFYHYGAALRVKVFDATNERYFNLSQLQGSVTGTEISISEQTAFPGFTSVRFDVTEFGEDCESIRVRFENAGSTDAYINAPQMVYDKTGKWPQAYFPGPISVAMSNGVGIELITINTTSANNSSPLNISTSETTIATIGIDLGASANIPVWWRLNLAPNDALRFTVRVYIDETESHEVVKPYYSDETDEWMGTDYLVGVSSGEHDIKITGQTDSGTVSIGATEGLLEILLIAYGTLSVVPPAPNPEIYAPTLTVPAYLIVDPEITAATRGLFARATAAGSLTVPSAPTVSVKTEVLGP